MHILSKLIGLNHLTLKLINTSFFKIGVILRLVQIDGVNICCIGMDM